MKRLTCEMCGSIDLIKQDSVFVCQACGTKYSVEEAKKMMVEGTVEIQGTVRVDNSSSVEKYLQNARRALVKEDWEEVEKYYNMVEQDTPDNMEAVFFSSYGKAMLSMTDSDYFKREQKFEVLNRSMSVISDYYDTTTENKEETLRKITTYIEKMYNVSFVYEQQGISLVGAFNALTGATGTKQWCLNLFNSTKSTFVHELKEIAQKHDDAFVKELIDKLEPPMDVRSLPIEVDDGNGRVATLIITRNETKTSIVAVNVTCVLDSKETFQIGYMESVSLPVKYGRHKIDLEFKGKALVPAKRKATPEFDVDGDMKIVFEPDRLLGGYKTKIIKE